jgi:hypothetical protein
MFPARSLHAPGTLSPEVPERFTGVQINGRGQLRVSRKVLLEGYTGDDDDGDYTPSPPAPRPPRPTDRDQDRPKIVRKKAE